MGDMLRAIRLGMDDRSFTNTLLEKLSRSDEWCRRMIILSFRRSAVLEACDVGDMLRAIRLTMDAESFRLTASETFSGRSDSYPNTLIILSFRRSAVLEACDVGDMLRAIRLTMEEPEFILQVQNKLSKGRFWANQIVLLSFRRSAVLEALASGTVAAALRLVLKNASACSDEEINADNFISISPGVKLGDQTIGWVSESTIVRFPTVVDLAFLRILGGVSVVTISVLAEVVTFRWAAFSFGLTIGWVSGGTIVCFPTVVPFRWAAFSFGLTIGWVSGATIAPFGEVVALLRIIGGVRGTIVCFPTVVPGRNSARSATV